MGYPPGNYLTYHYNSLHIISLLKVAGNMIIEFHCPLFDGRICYIMLFGFLQRTFVPCIDVGCMTLQALV